MTVTAVDPSRVDRARAALARGDLIATYDLACAALGDHEPGADFLVVLSLARMGDTDAANERYVALGLDRAIDTDTRSLGASLAKSAAECLEGEAQREGFAKAGAAYAAIHDDTGAVFPAINAASLALLAGDHEAARCRAEALLPATAEPLDYWTGASRAEALVLLGEDELAEQALAAALDLPGSNLGARASTLRQLELLAEHAGADTSGRVRAKLRPPVAVFYCGHMFLAGTAAETELAARIDAALAEHDIGIGFGALACGADIVTAERLLARGGELNVVLPFNVADFTKLSVTPGGASWLPRFEACLAAAHSVHIASEIGDIGDDGAFNHGSTTAMGLTLLRASHLGGSSALLAVWDSSPARGIAGTGIDVERWQTAGYEVLVLPPGDIDRRIAPIAPVPIYTGPVRAPMALIFADAPGFSKLSETEIPHFWRDVMGTASRVIARFGAAVRSRNSWGDAVFVVVDNVAAAAEIMLSLQEEIAEVCRFRLRIGAHYGMVFETDDQVTGQRTFYGTEVSRAARIEPVTPAGRTYVTETFAAALAIEAPQRFRCHYVGRVALAKGYGTFPMYRLSRA